MPRHQWKFLTDADVDALTVAADQWYRKEGTEDVFAIVDYPNPNGTACLRYCDADGYRVAGPGGTPAYAMPSFHVQMRPLRMGLVGWVRYLVPEVREAWTGEPSDLAGAAAMLETASPIIAALTRYELEPDKQPRLVNP